MQESSFGFFLCIVFMVLYISLIYCSDVMMVCLGNEVYSPRSYNTRNSPLAWSYIRICNGLKNRFTSTICGYVCLNLLRMNTNRHHVCAKMSALENTYGKKDVLLKILKSQAYHDVFSSFIENFC